MFTSICNITIFQVLFKNNNNNNKCLMFFFLRLGVLNKDGNCKCFDESADGYTRAEALIIIVVQKSKDARRIYSRVYFIYLFTFN